MTTIAKDKEPSSKKKTSDERTPWSSISEKSVAQTQEQTRPRLNDGVLGSKRSSDERTQSTASTSKKSVTQTRERSRSRSKADESGSKKTLDDRTPGASSSSDSMNRFWITMSRETFLNINTDSLDDYEIRAKIGEGSFGIVYEGFHTKKQKKVALKVLKPQRVKFVKREVYILSLLAGKPNIVELLDVVKDQLTAVPVFVFDFTGLYNPWSEILRHISVDGIKDYTYQLLNALAQCRNSCILHRDVKPANVLYAVQERKLVLIDFGTAETFHLGKTLIHYVGTREYRSPELLMLSNQYDYSTDIWSLGCILGQLVLGNGPLFGVAENNEQQLLRIGNVYGSEALKKCLNLGVKNKKVADTSCFDTVMQKLSERARVPCKEWRDLGTRHNVQKIEKCEALGVFDLLSKVLNLDPEERLCPDDAMNHGFLEDRLPYHPCRSDSSQGRISGGVLSPNTGAVDVEVSGS